jgi:hypothetical protein
MRFLVGLGRLFSSPSELEKMAKLEVDLSITG